MKNKELTGIRDWKLRDIKEGDLITTQQGTDFVVVWDETYNQWALTEVDEMIKKRGMYELRSYMQSNLEITGSIYDLPNEI